MLTVNITTQSPAMNEVSSVSVCFLGCGNLGSAILSGLLVSSNNASKETQRFSRFIATVRSQSSVTRLQEQFCDYTDKLSVFQNDNIRAVSESDVIILATDPTDVESVLTEPGLCDQLSQKLLISVAAGWTRQKLEGVLYGEGHSINAENRAWVIRTLPNVAAVVHAGLTVIETPHPDLPPGHMDTTKSIFDCVGKTMVLQPHLLDAATAVGGSTPAFFAVICEAFIDASVAVGVPRDIAHGSIAQSMLGTARMLLSGMQPSAVKDKGTSPEGCTMSGLMILEETAVRGHVGRALREAVTVARSMGTVEHVNDTRH
ncbi:hypothetical protein QQS21_006908 [Conoideocrella luteorostrata]|uniref:Pyrroline-5-carboxylate reductase n=1 Tax=Conoideocrella luteorostrata TaxID=1105319 RepID=A0AAJ0CPN6_9HYPO|nr:hypothetical protein QQS21_006908 [Conoideocrella luteorostrata]